MFSVAKKAFALPSIMIASIVMMSVLAVTLSATTATRNALKDQKYTQLSQLAAEAGQNYAKACLANNGNIPQWTNAKPLKPNTDCSGNETTACTDTSTSASCWVLIDGNIKSTFSVPLPPVDSTGRAGVVPSTGSVKLIRTSSGVAWKTYNQSINVTGPTFGSNISVSGGVLTSDATYYYRTFNANDTLTVSGGSLSVDILVVGGGGGGGTDTFQDRSSGGGGAGGYISVTNYSVAAGSYAVTVGGGGAGGQPVASGSAVRGSNGGNSSIFSYTAIGGGGGAGHDNGGNYGGGNGGSGGGSTHDGLYGPPGLGTSGQGYNGGTAGNTQGGAGLQWLDGIFYASGGAGSSSGSWTGGGGGGGGGTGVAGSFNGGNGGGGSSGNSTGVVTGTAGVRGSGGGASRETTGGIGGSGVVKIRYLKSAVLSAPSITTNGLVVNLDAGNTSSYPGTGNTWFDLSGNSRNATLVGSPTYSSSDGGYLNFTGGTSYANLPNAFGVGTGQVTVESWVYLTSSTTNNIIFASQSSNAAGFYGLGANSTNGWFMTTYDGASRPTRYYQNVQSLNGWYHVVGQRDASNNLQLYVNGNAATTTAASSTLSFTSADPRMAINPASGGENWSGRMSVLRIYNRALSQLEIQQNYDALKSRYTPSLVTSGLVMNLDAGNSASYPGSGANWTDTQSSIVFNNNSTAPSFTPNSSNLPASFGFAANAMFIAPENAVLNTQTPTVEVWVKTNNLNQNGFFFEKGQVNTQYALFQEGTNIIWRHNFGAGCCNNAVASSSALSTSSWKQLVGTFTSGVRKIYVNGVVVGSDAATGTIQTNSNGSSVGVYGGYNGGRGYYYNGSISTVKVYNRALSDAEVLQNFNAQKARFGV